MQLRFRRWIWLTISLLAFAGVSHAEKPRVYPEQGIQTFLGLDDTSAPTQVQDGRAQDIQNVSLDISKSIRKRFGVKVIGTTLDIPGESFCTVEGIYYTKFSSGTDRIMAICGSRAYYLSGSSWVQIRTPTVTSITAGQNNQFVFTTALDKVIFTNDVNVPLQWGGGASEHAAAVSFTGLTNSIEHAKTVAFFKNYLVFGNTTENGTTYSTRIRFSNVGTINTWTDADFIDIGALGGQEITAMAELYDNLYVFLTDSIYKVSLVGGSDTFQVSKVTDDIGCIAKNSVQSVTLTNAQNGLVFLDKDKKIYFFNGVIAQDISQFLTVTMSGLSGSRLQYAVSADSNTSYILCTTSGTGSTNNLCLELQYQIGEWTKHTNIPANAMAHVLDNNTTDQVYWGSYKSLVYQFADSSLRNDVATATGTVSSVNTATTSTASGLQVLYVNSAAYTTGAFVGAPIKLVGGTGSSQTGTIANNTTTGIIVTDAFSTTPDSTTTFQIGAIDAFYTTKWYDFGNAATLKHFGEVYFWADADVSSTHSLSYATDFNSDISTLSLSLASSSADAIWGSAVWGVSLWGSVDNVFRQGKLTDEGRYIRFKWADSDPDENFHIYGYSTVFWDGDTL